MTMAPGGFCVLLKYRRAPGRPKPARSTTRSECTCDARPRIAYTSDA
jgi:hypothetical protein